MADVLASPLASLSLDGAAITQSAIDAIQIDEHDTNTASDSIYNTNITVEQLDALDDASLSSPSALFALINLMESQLRSIRTLNESISAADSDYADTDGDNTSNITTRKVNTFLLSLDREARKVREHFSKLKMNFLHLQSKDVFLQHLSNIDQPLPSLTESDIAERNAALSAKRQSLAQCNEELKNLKMELKYKLKEFAVEWNQLQADKREFQHTFDEKYFQNYLKEIEMLGLASIEDGANVPLLEKLIDDDERGIEALEKELQLLESEYQTQHQQCQQLEEKYRETEARVSALAINDSNDDGDNDTGRSKELHWYDTVIRALSHFHGLAVLPSQSERSLKIRVESADKSRSVTLECDVVPNTLFSFNGVFITEGEELLISDDWETLLDYALDKQDLPFLCREVQRMIGDKSSGRDK